MHEQLATFYAIELLTVELITVRSELVLVRSRSLLHQFPRLDTFLGRKTHDPFPKEDEVDQRPRLAAPNCIFFPRAADAPKCAEECGTAMNHRLSFASYDYGA
jgi:hypothetical protein